jgi:hypothetical protein
MPIIFKGEAIGVSTIDDLYRGVISSNSNIKGAWALTEGAGNKSYDLSGNSNDGTLNGTLADMWANTQDSVHYNIQYGVKEIDVGIYTDVLVPYQIDKTETTVAGESNVTKCPAGNHMCSIVETKIKQPDNARLKAADTGNFWYSVGGVAQAKSYSDIDAETETYIRFRQQDHFITNLKFLNGAKCLIKQ